jgi:uncharacterized protein HemX
MSESTPESEKTGSPARSSHLKPVRDEASTPTPAQSGPVRQGGGHMTGLLALLLAVAVFALLAQFSGNRQLQAENQALGESLAATQAELDATRAQMTEARDAVGGLRDLLVRIEGLLAPPVPAAGEAAPAAPNAEAPPAPAE